MRFFGISAITMAILTLTATAPVSAEDTGHRIAVVDVAYIFKNHEGIKAQVGSVENNLKTYDGQLKQKRDELRQAAEQLKTFKVGSPDYAAKEDQVAAMESKLRLDMARKKKELQDSEAKIYYLSLIHI